MACFNSSLSSLIFVSDLPSYGVIGLVAIGLILYVSYMISYIRNDHSSPTVYIYIVQILLLFTLICTVTFLCRPSVLSNLICPLQTLTIQICPCLLLLAVNVHFIQQWLIKTTRNSSRKRCLISFCSFLIFLLGVLIQTGILLVWFSNHHQSIFDRCTKECSRPLFLGSLSLNFILIFLFSLQSSIRYHFSNSRNDFIYLLISLSALCVTMIWICFYLFLPLKSSITFYMNQNFILAYGNLFFVYTFLGPLLFEQLFYQPKRRFHQSDKLTFKSLSLTKEQQRVFMAAYIKRNLTASCESLTAMTFSSPISTPRQIDRTRHSTLSVDSLCPTLASVISHDYPAKTITDASSCGTLTSEYLLRSTSAMNTNQEMK